MHFIHELVAVIGDFAGAIFTLAFALYLIPGSPLRRWAETWIERRVSQRFDKELETYRHRLSLDAEQVRAEHQRLLHNATLVIERKHEVYRELFKLLHIANGGVSGLFGLSRVPTFEDYSRADITAYLDQLRLPGKTRDSILQEWDSDRRAAVRQLRNAERFVSIEKANAAYSAAWNYYLLNSIYLDDPLSLAAARIFEPLRGILIQAEIPDAQGAKDVINLKKEASDLLETLLKQFRAELRVSDSDASVTPAIAPPAA